MTQWIVGYEICGFGALWRGKSVCAQKNHKNSFKNRRKKGNLLSLVVLLYRFFGAMLPQKEIYLGEIYFAGCSTIHPREYVSGRLGGPRFPVTLHCDFSRIAGVDLSMRAENVGIDVT